MKYTATITKTEDGMYIAQCEQVPEAVTQGNTLKEVLVNIKDAINLVLLDRKLDTQEKYAGKKTLRRIIAL